MKQRLLGLALIAFVVIAGVAISGTTTRLAVNSTVSTVAVVCDPADTGSEKGVTFVDTYWSEALDISGSDFDYLYAHFIRTGVDTGSVLEANDTANDTFRVAIFTYMTDGGGVWLAQVDTDTSRMICSNRDSAIFRAIPRDSLYDYIKFRTIYNDTIDVTDVDTNIHNFLLEVYVQ